MLRAGVFAALLATPAAAEGVSAARYADPTTRYDHGILGDAVEHGALVMETDTGRRLKITLPDSRVFEDTAPRLADLDGDGAAEVIAVETDIVKGARLSVYGPDGLIASNDFIGQTHRWLAPVGAADFDGDGSMEIAYVDRPHLAKKLMVWRFRPGQLEFVGEYPGVTNHRIGESDIAGGIRDCGGKPEMVVASADWARIVAVRFDGSRFAATDLGPYDGRASFAKALSCK